MVVGVAIVLLLVALNWAHSPRRYPLLEHGLTSLSQDVSAHPSLLADHGVSNSGHADSESIGQLQPLNLQGETVNGNGIFEAHGVHPFGGCWGFVRFAAAMPHTVPHTMSLSMSPASVQCDTRAPHVGARVYTREHTFM